MSGNKLPPTTNSVLDERGDIKIQLQEQFLRRVAKGRDDVTECNNIVHRTVCTGQQMYSPIRLFEGSRSEEISITTRGKAPTKHFFNVTVTQSDAPLDMKESPDLLVLNNVVQQAFATKFPSKVGPKLISMEEMDTYERDGVTCLHGVIPRVTKIKIGNDISNVLQVSPALRVMSNMSVMDLISKIRDQPGTRKYWETLELKLVGKKVATRYGSRGGAVYRISGVSQNKTVNSTFESKKGVEITFKSYFQDKYSISLIDNQPLLKVKECGIGRSNRPVFLPVQVVQLLHLEDHQLSLLPKICSIYPQERMRRMQSALTSVLACDEAKGLLRSFGITLGTTPITIQGEVLPEVAVQIPGVANEIFTGSAQYTSPLGFAMELSKIKFPEPTNRTTYTLLDFVPERLQRFRGKISQDISKEINQTRSSFNFDIQSHKLEVNNIRQCLEKVVCNIDPSKRSTTFALVHLERKDKFPYLDVKETLLKHGILSQVVANDPKTNVIQKMIQQQMSAKIGTLNWSADLTKTSPTLTQDGIVIIGIDTANTMKDSFSDAKATRTPTFVVALVAFHFHPKSGWSHFCDHAVLRGKRQTFGASGESETETTATSATDEHYDVATSVADALRPFLEKMHDHFKDLEYTTVLCSRGSESDGEIVKAQSHDPAVMSDFCKAHGKKGILVAAQRGSKTRFFFDPSTMNGCGKELVNPPRGFYTVDAVPLTDGNEDLSSGFYVVGARCNLGHAKATKYNIIPLQENTAGAGVSKEIASLFYSLCFLFPNKADGLPYPLPLKAANRYANLFVLMSQLEKSLGDTLKPRLHYL